MMKRFFIFQILIFMTILVIGQSGYTILKNAPLPISSTRPRDSKYILQYYTYINGIIKLDQKIRDPKYVKSIYSFRYVDSLIFLTFQNVFKEGGLISLQKSKIERHIQNVDDFLTINFVLQLHFSDRFAFPYMKMIEESLKESSCDEFDLMNYFITYLWRKTEFIYEKILGIPYHIILVPNFESGKFSKYYEYAMRCFIQYCGENDTSFLYLQLSNIHVKKGVIDANQYLISNFFKGMTPFIRWAIDAKMNLIKKWVYFSNALKIEDGNYNILICSHPKGSVKPPYLY